MTQRPGSAVFVVRAWWEGEQFRARLTYCVDIDAGPAAETTTVTADPAEVRRRLASWLDDVASATSS
jgi:hypothetical protein